MRIAHVTGVHDGLNGGIERHVFNLAVAQKARGDSPLVVVAGRGGLTEACDKYGIPAVIEERLYGGTRLSAGSTDPETIKTIDELCSLFSKLDVEVIHSHSGIAGPKAIAAGNKIGIPCVFSNHHPGSTQLSSYERLGLLKFAVIAVCRDSIEAMKREGFPEEALFYVPNGTKSVPRATKGSTPPDLISVGRLQQVKGLDIAILAMVELGRRHGPDSPVLNIYGEGDLERHLKEMVSVLGLDEKVRLHGAQPGILERCPDTDILVIPSRAETGPLIALEAMSRGMPIVSTRVGEMAEVIPDQRYGRIVESHSIIALADGIDSMLSDVRAGRFDPNLPIERHSALFTVEKMADRLDAAYKDWIAREACAG